MMYDDGGDDGGDDGDGGGSDGYSYLLVRLLIHQWKLL